VNEESATEVMKRIPPAYIEEDARRRWVLDVLADLSEETPTPPGIATVRAP
jgi:hypothetical protein